MSGQAGRKGLERHGASMQHAELIRRKLDDLAGRLLATQTQLYTSADRDYRVGLLTMSDLADLYQWARTTIGPGFSTQWNLHMSVEAPAVRTHIYNAPPAATGPGGLCWVGPYPYDKTTVTPPRHTSVVYVLYDINNEPIYVGSSAAFRDRMRRHGKTKPVTSWMAYPCESREAAYLLESDLLNQRRPRMNGTGRGAAA